MEIFLSGLPLQDVLIKRLHQKHSFCLPGFFGAVMDAEAKSEREKSFFYGFMGRATSTCE
jgi:hypothetical protein